MEWTEKVPSFCAVTIEILVYTYSNNYADFRFRSFTELLTCCFFVDKYFLFLLSKFINYHYSFFWEEVLLFVFFHLSYSRAITPSNFTIHFNELFYIYLFRLSYQSLVIELYIYRSFIIKKKEMTEVNSTNSIVPSIHNTVFYKIISQIIRIQFDTYKTQPSIAHLMV